ncbi:MAG: CBS domain-containing protein [Candidatus Omnitrophica bacterium]|nr:CBS domain-containing protein [Candidatus Omnitrophota bacterium]MDD5653369.1 CBS domain-containing protein [Candidatus Omnitrophota bacterium]
MENNNKRMFVYFSQLMGLPVFGRDGAKIGIFYDCIVKPTQVYPQSSHLIIRKGFFRRKYALVNWQDIEEIAEDSLKLKLEQSKITFKGKHNNKEELALRRDILDQQVVDTYNHKVIRVNDIHLLEVDHCLMIAHVDISLRGLIRRLGLEKIIDFCVGVMNKNSDYVKTEHLISWKHIQPLSVNPVSMTIKIDLPQKQFNNIPAADLGEIFLDLNMQHQVILFKSLDLATRARIFINIDFNAQKYLIEELEPKEAVEMLNSIPTDEATDFLDKLPQEMSERFLSLMESKQSKKLSELLGYSSDSAGGLMTTEYMAFTKETTVESALKQIRERIFKVEPAQFVYIVDEGHHLIGATNFRRLMLSAPTDLVQNAAFPKIKFVHLESSVKEVAYLMEKYKYYVIPVVDKENVLKGIITVDDILSQVISIAWRRLKKIKPKLHKT